MNSLNLYLQLLKSSELPTDLLYSIVEYCEETLWEKLIHYRSCNENSDSAKCFDDFISGAWQKKVDETPAWFPSALSSRVSGDPVVFQWYCRVLHPRSFDDEFDAKNLDRLELHYLGNYSVVMPVSKDEEAKIRKYLHDIRLLK